MEECKCIPRELREIIREGLDDYIYELGVEIETQQEKKEKAHIHPNIYNPHDEKIKQLEKDQTKIRRGLAYINSIPPCVDKYTEHPDITFAREHPLK